MSPLPATATPTASAQPTTQTKTPFLIFNSTQTHLSAALSSSQQQYLSTTARHSSSSGQYLKASVNSNQNSLGSAAVGGVLLTSHVQAHLPQPHINTFKKQLSKPTTPSSKQQQQQTFHTTKLTTTTATPTKHYETDLNYYYRLFNPNPIIDSQRLKRSQSHSTPPTPQSSPGIHLQNGGGSVLKKTLNASTTPTTIAVGSGSGTTGGTTLGIGFGTTRVGRFTVTSRPTTTAVSVSATASASGGGVVLPAAVNLNQGSFSQQQQQQQQQQNIQQQKNISAMSQSGQSPLGHATISLSEENLRKHTEITKQTSMSLLDRITQWRQSIPENMDDHGEKIPRSSSSPSSSQSTPSSPSSKPTRTSSSHSNHNHNNINNTTSAATATPNRASTPSSRLPRNSSSNTSDTFTSRQNSYHHQHHHHHRSLPSLTTATGQDGASASPGPSSLPPRQSSRTLSSNDMGGDEFGGERERERERDYRRSKTGGVSGNGNGNGSGGGMMRGRLLCCLKVEIKTGVFRMLPVHENDSAVDLAKDFCSANNLSNSVDALSNHITTSMKTFSSSAR